ncbi:caspase family protein [Phreatobacter stygius]|uniref:Caspase family protein n=1 Tax=Phreatobacter stygius TaxID=1940610 RepID=A0A4D7AZN6_9HYPH|nr:caspase family protein [Phreatobacter stygius]QCI64098.1 caspase family protein [Phreatobacter stygius]
MPPRFFGDDDSGWTAPAAPPSRRVALVVGNGAYRTSRLENPARDARLVAGALDQLGFDTELAIDASKTILETAIVRLGERLEKAGPEAVGFFYFAGHGIQHQGANYLVPIDAHIPDTRYLKSGAILVDYLVEELGRTHSLANVIVLDACRDSAVRDTGGSLTQGLASIQNLPDGTLVVFSTAAGQVADDGSGDNSPYAGALVRHLLEPNRRLEEIFFSVSRDVALTTGNSQRPALFVQGAIAPLVLKPAPEPPSLPPPGPVWIAAPPAVLPPPPPAHAAVEARATPRTVEATIEAPTEPAPWPTSIGNGATPTPAAASPWNAPATATLAPAPVRSRPQTLAGDFSGPSLRTRLEDAARLLPSRSVLGGALALALAALIGGYALWPARLAVDVGDPASWPVAPDGALVWRAPPDQPCRDGWTRVLDGLYCLRSGQPLGAIWEAGRLVAPLAGAVNLKISAKTGGRCPATSLFEAETACLDPVTPSWFSTGARAAGPSAMTIAGASAGMAVLTPKTSVDCASSSAQFPFAGYCLIGAARLGLVTPTALGHERLSGLDGSAGAITLTAYQRLASCPPQTTVLENDKYCLAMALW